MHDTSETQKRSAVLIRVFGCRTRSALTKEFRNACQRRIANLRLIAEILQPDQTGLPAEPCDLPLRIVARISLCVENRIPRTQLVANQLQGLLVAMRLERLALRREAERENALHLL